MHGNPSNPAAGRTAALRPAAYHADMRLSSHMHEADATQCQAELFYLQKQIQSRTPMIFILEDGERVEGVIEWYDRNSIKIGGRQRMLLYKSAIKYMFKENENGQ